MQNVITRTWFEEHPSPICSRSVVESDFYIAIAVAFVGFFVLAFVLLFPVYRFMKREEKRSEAWTDSAIADRRRRALEKAERASSEGDGAGGLGEPPEVIT